MKNTLAGKIKEMGYGQFLFLYFVARNLECKMTTKVLEAFKDEKTNSSYSSKQNEVETLKVRKGSTATPD